MISILLIIICKLQFIIKDSLVSKKEKSSSISKPKKMKKKKSPRLYFQVSTNKTNLLSDSSSAFFSKPSSTFIDNSTKIKKFQQWIYLQPTTKVYLKFHSFIVFSGRRDLIFLFLILYIAFTVTFPS